MAVSGVALTYELIIIYCRHRYDVVPRNQQSSSVLSVSRFWYCNRWQSNMLM